MSYSQIQDGQWAVSLDAQSTNNTTSNGTSVACAGYATVFAYARIHSSAGVGTLKVQYSTDNSAWTDLTGATYTITVNSDDTNHGFAIDLRNVPGGDTGVWLRWVQIETNTGAVVTTGAFVLLDPKQSPASASERGLTTYLAI